MAKRINQYIDKGDYYEVITRKNEVILIDKDDYELCKKHYWSINSQGYPISVINRKHKRLHLYLMEKPQGMVIDHINGNTKDNRRGNLRVCTPKENSRNTSASKNNKTGYLGISMTPHGKYRARIMVDRKEIRLGHYETLEEAVSVRREAELKYFKEYSPSLRNVTEV